MRRSLLAVLLLLSTHAFANADLSVRVDRVEPGTPFFGLPYTYALTVHNAGPQVAHDVVAMWYFLDEALPQQVPDPRCAVAQSNAFRCTFGGMAAGETIQLTSRAVADTVWSEVTSSVHDPNATNNRFVLVVRPVHIPSAITSNITMPARMNPDATVTIRYSIKNQSHWPADVQAKINLTLATEIVSANASCVRSSEPGVFARCTLPKLEPGQTFDLDLTVRFPAPHGEVATLLTPVWLENGAEGTSVQMRNTYPRTFRVTSAADSGAGSLRQAILDANVDCANQPLPCTIDMEIPAPVPADGWFTIKPLTPLPAIAVWNLTIDGSRQTTLTGDTNPAGPELFLDGAALAKGNGFLVRTPNVTIQDFAIGNFADNAIFALRIPPHGYVRVVAQRNFIGVTPNGATAPNLRGIMIPHGAAEILDSVIASNRLSGIYAWNASVGIARNRIERNGASGIFLGVHASSSVVENSITNNREFGVAVVNENTTRVSLRGNRIHTNGLGGIDLGLDGPTLDGPGPVPPTITAAYFDGQSTYVLGFAPPETTGQLAERYFVELYGNTQLDEHGLAEGERLLIGSVAVQPDGHFAIVFSETDLRGLYINGIGTKLTTVYGGEAFWYQSSEFGRVKKVE